MACGGGGSRPPSKANSQRKTVEIIPEAEEPEDGQRKPSQFSRKKSIQLVDIGTVLKNRWHVVKQLGEGGFGQIYIAKDINDEQLVAVKAESSTARMPLLRMEVTVLRKLQGQQYVAAFYACGRGTQYNYLVMSLLGKNLMELKKFMKDEKFSLSTACRTAKQMISGVEAVHSGGFLHRDIKPSNFAIGKKSNGTDRIVHILDFGLCRSYLGENGAVRAPRQSCGFRGTVRYASITVHESRDTGRHDDLWSLFYILIEMTKGQLPWRNIIDKEKVCKLKKQTPTQNLLSGCPAEFKSIFEELQRMNYFSTPNYFLLRQANENILNRLGVTEQSPFDWELPSYSSPDPPSHTNALQETRGQALLTGSKDINPQKTADQTARDAVADPFLTSREAVPSAGANRHNAVGPSKSFAPRMGAGGYSKPTANKETSAIISCGSRRGQLGEMRATNAAKEKNINKIYRLPPKAFPSSPPSWKRFKLTKPNKLELPNGGGSEVKSTAFTTTTNILGEIEDEEKISLTKKGRQQLTRTSCSHNDNQQISGGYRPFRY